MIGFIIIVIFEDNNTMETSHNVPAAATAAQHDANLGLINKEYGRNPEGEIEILNSNGSWVFNVFCFSCRSPSSDSCGDGGDIFVCQDWLRL